MEESRLPGSAPARFAADILSLFQSCVRRPESHDCAAAGEDSEVDERAEQSAGIRACSFSSRRTGPRPGRAPGCRAQRAHDRLCAHILCPPAHRQPTGQRRAAPPLQARGLPGHPACISCCHISYIVHAGAKVPGYISCTRQEVLSVQIMLPSDDEVLMQVMSEAA